jgi:hypothetical protein
MALVNDYSSFLGGTTNQPHETFNLPDAYHGKNKHLEDVLDFMIRKEDEFYTQRLLPWQHTDELHVKWDIFTFNRSIMDVEPEQGIPRLVTSEMDTKSDNLLRRGLAFIIEHGFMTTERGRRTFMLNLQQITDAVHTTAYYGVMTALLGEADEYINNGRVQVRNFKKKERHRWACVQKSHKGLYVLDAELKYEMARKQVVPNTWVFPPKMSIYLDMAPPEQTEFRLKGPLAAGNLEEDRSNKGISWRGTRVFESQPFDVEFTDEPDDLLSQQRQCGEYFHFKPTDLQQGNPDAFIQIYDAGSDTFQKITLGECQEHDLMNHAVYWGSEEGGGETKRSAASKPSSRSSRSAVFDEAAMTGRSAVTASKNQFNLSSLEVLNKTAPSDIIQIAKWRTRAQLVQLAGVEAMEIGTPRAFDVADGVIRANLTIEQCTIKDDGKKVISPDATEAVKTAVRETYEQRRSEDDGYFTQGLTIIAKQISGPQGVRIATANVLTETEREDLFLGFGQALDSHIKAGGEADSLSTHYKTLKSKKKDDQKHVRAFFDTLLDTIYRVEYECLHQLLTYIYAAQSLNDPNVDYIIFRPFQTYRMSSALLAAGGTELGSTFHGHHDFQLSDDIIRKVHVGHYTHYSKSVIKQPKRFTTARYVYAQEYLHGESLQFYDKTSLESDGSTGELGKNGSLLVISIDKPDRTLAHVINITGIMDDTVDIPSISRDTTAIHHRIEQCGLRHIMQAFTETEVNNKFDTDILHVNLDCFPGAMLDNEGRCITKNMGHWGDLTYPGCMRVREGDIMHIDKEKVLQPGSKYAHSRKLGLFEG